MGLFQPSILWLALAAGAALVIAYYLQRRKAPRVLFSAVRFLPESSRVRTAKAAMPPPRLLIPLAIAALVFLSIAQPLLSQSQPTPLALVVDDGAFAGGKTQGMLQAAVAVSGSMPPGAQWAVFTTSGQTIASGSGRPELVSVLKSYSTPMSQPSYSPAVFGKAVDFVKERAGATPLLVLVGNTNTLLDFPGLDKVRGELDKKSITLLTVLDRGMENPAFIAATDMPRLARLGDEARARVGIANTTSDTLTGEIRLVAEGSVIMRAQVRLPGQSIKWEELRVTPQNRGITKYDINLSVSGKQTAEDKITWNLAAYTRQQVIVLASTSSATPGYIEKALRASPLVDSVIVVEPESLDVTKLRQFLASSRVVILDGVDAATLPIELGAELKAWTEAGGLTAFAGGTKVTEAWNKNILGTVLPAAIKMKKDKPLEGVSVRDTAITRDLELDTTPLSVSQWLSVDKVPPEQVLVSVGGEPILLWRKVKQGTVLFWASTTDPRWNNWARYPSFPVFWSNVVEYAVSGDTQSGAEKPVGASALWRTHATPELNDAVYFVESKDGSPVVLPAAMQGAMDRPSRGYRGYHEVFLAASAVLALAYLWLTSVRKPKVLA